MALSVTMMIHLFFNILLSLPWISSGFSLRLVHRDSPHSPLYQPNLSDFDRFKKNIWSSKARASHFEQLIETETLRLPLKYIDPIFTVEIGLGTPIVNTTLAFDTGSGLTWTQCKPCIRCFKQEQPLFDIRKSRSYKKIPKRHKLSKSFLCSPLGCAYYVSYYSGQISSGIASSENFTFQSSAGVLQRVPGLVFGCGMNNRGQFPRQLSGIFGLDKEPISFARQLGSQIKGRFSYCLPIINSNITKESYVRFGDEAVIRGKNAQRTPFLKDKRSAILYGLKLSDISINGKKLGLTYATFPDGCYIDSGASISLLNRRAFFAATSIFTTYFSKYKNVTRYAGKEAPKGFVCYRQPRGFRDYPNMTFHFQGAHYHIPSQNLFVSFESKFFCLAMMGSPNVSILGAYQQRNVKILYDLKEEMLSFAPQNCSEDTV